MGLISDAAVSRGDVARRQARQEREIAAVRTARRAEATSVGAGGFQILDGGEFVARFPSGAPAVLIGEVSTATDATSGHGLIVQTDGPLTSQRDIFSVHDNPTNGRRAFFGDPTGDPDGAVGFWGTWADFFQVVSYDVILLRTLDGGSMTLHSDGSIIGQAAGAVQFLADDGAAIGGSNGTFIQPEENLVDSANVHMDPVTGRVTYVSSSSERVKRDIQDLAIDPAAVLAMRARSWLPGATVRTCPPWLHEQHKTDADCHDGETIDPPEDSRRVVGFVAEELDQIGLGDFVVYDDEGLPSSIAYDRLTAALVPLLQTQQAQIDALTARLDALESKEA